MKIVTVSLFSLAAVLILVVLLNAAFGVVYDTDAFSDTLLLSGAAWRIHSGLQPGVDFGHLYGGIDATGVALIMRLIDGSIASVEYFTAFAALFFSALAAAILYRRASPFTVAATILAITVLLVGRFPLEFDPLVRVYSSHAFLYNRIGHVTILIAGLFVALRSDLPKLDAAAGVLVGFVGVVALLAKPTFFVLAPAVLIGLLLQGRWHAAIGVLVGTAAVILALDPTLARWIGSIRYSQAQLAGSDSLPVEALIRKAVQLPLAQPLASLVAATGLGVLAMRRLRLRAVAGLLIVAVAGLAMTASMGGNGTLAALILPIAILVSLSAYEIARADAADFAQTLMVLSSITVLSVAGPQGLNVIASILEGNLRRDEMLISEGPFARYLSLPEIRPRGEPTQYEMFADGIEILSRLGPASDWGIAADQNISFEYALQARPADFPLWQRLNTPEVRPRETLSESIDVLLLSRHHEGNAFQTLLLDRAEGFSPCTRTGHWAVLVRDGVAADCDL